MVIITALGAWSVPACAQPLLNWERTYGGTEFDGLGSLALMPDGGILAAGSSRSAGPMVEANNGETDFWIVRTDDMGNMLWNRTYGGSSEDRAWCVRPGMDGTIHLVGHTLSSDAFGTPLADMDIVYMALDPDGEVLHQRRLSDGFGSTANDVLPLPDGGCIITGSTTMGADDTDVQLFRLDAAGDVVWQQRYGGGHRDVAFASELRAENELVVAATTRSVDGDVTGHLGQGDGWLLRVDLDGNLIDQRVLGDIYDDQLTRAVPTADGGLMLTGYRSKLVDTPFGIVPRTRVWAMKLSAALEVEWDRDFGGTQGDVGRLVLPTPDLGCILFAAAYSFDGDISIYHGEVDAWLIKLDADGDIVWDRTLGGTQEEAVGDILATPDDGLLLSIIAAGPNAEMSTYLGAADAWLVKLGGDGIGIDEHLGTAPIVRSDGTGAGYFVDLAPGAGTTHIALTDLGGKRLFEQGTAGTQVHLPMDAYAPGVYILQVGTGKGRHTFKLLRS